MIARTAGALLSAWMLASCTPPTVRLEAFSPREPKNYILVYEGAPVDFSRATCFKIEEATDTGRRDIGRTIREVLRVSAPSLPACHGSHPFSLIVVYHGGRGVCIDCGGHSSDPQSGFAFLSVIDSAGQQTASAEWQYWRGGSAEQMATQFVSDLINLWVHGAQKAPS